MLKKSLLGFVLLALVLPISSFGTAEAADFTIEPRVSASATYNDNVEEVKGGKGDYVGSVKPGVTTNYTASRFLFDLSYDFEYKTYLDGVRDNEFNHYLDALSKIEAIEERLFIEVSDTFTKEYEDSTRGEVVAGDTTSVGTTDRNVFSVKPYLTFPLQERTDFTLGAEFRDIWYSEEDSVDKRNYSAFADIDHELSDAWSVSFGGGYEKQDPRWEDGGYQQYNLSIGTAYSYAEGSSIEARWEPTHTDYEESRATDKQYHPYYLGVTHAFSETMTGVISTSLEFTEDAQSADPENKYVHQASLENTYNRGSYKFGVAYYDYEDRDTVSRTTYWRPSISGNHSLTERFSFKYNTYADLHTNPESDKYWFTMLNLDYSFTEKGTVGLSYRFKLNDKQSTDADYTSNTIGMTVAWAY